MWNLSVLLNRICTLFTRNYVFIMAEVNSVLKFLDLHFGSAFKCVSVNL